MSILLYQMRVNSPAVERAIEHLRPLLSDSAGTPARRLPPIRDLAALAGVSYVSMWRAVRHLRERGILSTNHRNGTRLAAGVEISALGTVVGPLVPTSAHTQWQVIARRIERSLVNAVYPPGSSLPSPKELSRLMGAGATTVRRALQWLAEEGWLEVSRRSYHVAVRPASRRGGTVVVVARGDSDGRPMFQTIRSQDQFRYLEQVCARSGVTPAVVTFGTEGRILQIPKEVEGVFAAQSGSAVSVLGIVLWTMGLHSGKAVDDITQQCLRSGHRVAILDETGDYGIGALAGGRGRVFRLACTQRSGQLMGHYLLENGHRVVAYISPVHAIGWSRQRLRGLEDAFGLAQGGRVLACTVDGTYSSLGTAVSIESRLNTLLDGCLQDRSEEGQLLSRALHSSRESINSAVRREAVHELLTPLVRAALDDHDVTAWVAASDGFALDCMGLLRARGMAVPGLVSLAGFDDTHEAFQHGLTSYNFNAPAVLHAMLQHLLGSTNWRDRPAGMTAGEVDGFVSVRRSTGRPPNHRSSTRG